MTMVRARGGRPALTTVLCGRCGQEIEHCYGDQTDWMHTSTRREHCVTGRLAVPETVEQYDLRRRGRHAANKRANTARRASRRQIDNDPEFTEWKRSVRAS